MVSGKLTQKNGKKNHIAECLLRDVGEERTVKEYKKMQIHRDKRERMRELM